MSIWTYVLCGAMADLWPAIDANGLRLGDLSDSLLALHLTIEIGGGFTLCVISSFPGIPRGGMYTTGISHT